MAYLHLERGSHNDDTLHQVLQFADIAWPRIKCQSFHGLLGDLFGLAAIQTGKLFDEEIGKHWNVLNSFSKGRDMERNDVQAIEEIFAKVPIFHFLIEVLI